MLTIVLLTLALVTFALATAYWLGRGDLLGWWIGMDMLKAVGDILGALLQAIADRSNSS